MPPEVVRLNLNINQETANALKAIAESQGLTMTEVIRRGITVLKYLTDELNAGRKIHTTDADGSNAREMVIL